MAHRFLLVFLFGLLTGASVPSMAGAQLLDLRSGDRVTVTLVSRPWQISGKFTGQIADSLYILVSASEPVSIPFSEVRGVSRHRIDRFSGALQGGAIGAAVAGGAFGALLAMTGGGGDCNGCPASDDFLFGAGIGGPPGALAGLIVGGIIGA